MKYINLLMVFLFMNTTNIFGQLSTSDVVFEKEQVKTYLEELNLDVNYNVNLTKLQVIPSEYEVSDDFTKFSRLKFYKLYTACAKGQINSKEKLSSFKEMKEMVFNPAGSELSVVFFDTEYSRFQDIESGRSAVKSYINSKDRNLFKEQISFEYGYATTLTKESLNTKSLKFVLTDVQFLGNRTFDQSSVSIDFGDGKGERTIKTDEQYNIKYKTWGTKEIRVSVQTEDGKTIKHIHSLKLEKEPFSSAMRGADLGLTCDEEDACWLSETLLASALVNCGTSFEDIRKPLIFLDGVDLFWSSNLMNVDSFFIDEDRNLGTVFQIPESTANQSMKDYLIEQGFDLIFVDYTDHHTRIQNNAAGVKELIRHINDIKAANGSKEKNLMIGFSMGGVIGKTALLEMENDGEDHDMSKYVTFDSPMQGAGIPLALQGLISQVSEVISEVDELSDFIDINPDTEESKIMSTILGVELVLQSPGPQQLLYNIYRKNNSSISSVSHTLFYDYLESLGELEQCTYFAVANGSLLGFPEGRQLNWDPNEPEPWNSNLLFDIQVGDDGFVVEIPNLIFQVIDALVVVEFGVKGRYQDGRNNVTVYEGEVKVGSIFNPYVNTHNPLFLPTTTVIDVCPGGSFPISKIIPSETLISTLNLINGFQMNETPNFCFIPTFSALDIQGGTFDAPISEDDETPAEMWVANVELVDGSEFNDFLYENDYHIGLNDRNMYFLTDIFVGKEENLSGANGMLTERYNYGYNKANEIEMPYTPQSTSSELNHNLIIEGEGRLDVNGSGEIGFMNQSGIENSSNSDFKLSINPSGCDNEEILVKVMNQGQFNIGDTNVGNTATAELSGNTKLEVFKNGELNLSEASKFIVSDGGTLRILSSGKLTAEPNSKLVIEEGAVLYLSAAELHLMEGSELHIKGSLLVEGHLDIITSGKIFFYPTSTLAVQGALDFIGEGQNAEIILRKDTQLSTSSVYSIKNMDLTFSHNSGLFIHDQQSFTIERVNISYDYIYNFPEFPSLLTTDDIPAVSVRQVRANNIRKSHLFEFNNSNSITISHCGFENVCRVLKATNSVQLDVTDVTIYLDDSNSRSFDITNINTANFSQVDSYTVGDAAEPTSNVIHYNINRIEELSLEDCAVRGGNSGVQGLNNGESGNQSNLSLSSVRFSNLDHGIKIFAAMNYGRVSLECSDFTNNVIAIEGRDLELIMDYPAANGQQANSFTRSDAPGAGDYYNPIIQIQYFLQPINELLARGNHWGFGGPISSDIYLIDASNGIYVSIPSVTYPYLTYISIDRCSRGGIGHEGPRSISDTHVDLKLYPNPASENITMDVSQGSTYFIIDVSGKILLSSQYDKEINISSLNSGIYFIRTVDKSSSKVSTQKFVKI